MLNEQVNQLFNSIYQYTISILIVTDNGNNNGSGCLLKLEENILVTNAHVINFALNEGHMFISGVKIENIRERLLSKSEVLDLATIKLSNEIVEELIKREKVLYEPPAWPPVECAPNDLVIISGFPGDLRVDDSFETSLYFTAILEELADVSDRRMITQFNRENWIKSGGIREIDELNQLGGFSGGPVFSFAGGILELVGFTYENGGNFFDGVQIVKSNLINSFGEIIESDLH